MLVKNTWVIGGLKRIFAAPWLSSLPHNPFVRVRRGLGFIVEFHLVFCVHSKEYLLFESTYTGSIANYFIASLRHRNR